MNMYRTPQGRHYKLTKHARNRMTQRQISKQDIERVLDSRHTSYCDIRGNLCLVGDSESGKQLKLVIAKDSDPAEIITLVTLD